MVSYSLPDADSAAKNLRSVNKRLLKSAKDKRRQAKRLRIFARALETGVCGCYDDGCCKGWECLCDLEDRASLCTCAKASCLAVAVLGESAENREAIFAELSAEVGEEDLEKGVVVKLNRSVAQGYCVLL